MEKKHRYLSFALILAVIILVHLLVVLLVKTNASAEDPAPGGQTDATVQPDQQRKPSPVKPFQLNYRYASRDKVPGLLTKEATTGILVDLDSGYVLWEKNSRKSVPIASMTKMMTMLVAFEEIEHRSDITLDTVVTVTRAAEKIGGTQVWLAKGEKFSLRDLMKTMMLRSANDSAYLVAEYFGGGDINQFITKMNRRADAMNMSGTKFYNVNGLPEVKNNISSPEALTRMAFELLKRPQVMKWASTRKDSFRDKSSKAYQMLVNTNKLVDSCPGVDGLKTGYIKASGSCITVTCKRGGRRLVAVATGFKSWKSRNAFIRKLLDWGYKRSSEIDLSSN
jgi:serine-type D-Ala-D-Ala carboxypeptidase (penicillin-binding protein 5/6)